MPHPTAIFRPHGEDFDTLDAACAALEGAGFTIGLLDRGNPCGFALSAPGLTGAAIGRWRDLKPAEQSALHGQLWTSRDGGTTVMLHNDASDGAVRAFAHVLACADAARTVMRMDKALGSAALALVPVLLLLGAALTVTP